MRTFRYSANCRTWSSSIAVYPQAMAGPTTNKKSMKTAARDRSAARVAGVAVLVSLFSFLYYLKQSNLLLYGDAVAHINIARRVFDSQTPGPLQLGTVWLPLPHVLTMPFVVSDALWQNGAGGSFVSMIAYVFGVVGIFRLVRERMEGAFSGHSQ